MTAKEYLRQIRRTEICIEQKKKEYNMLRNEQSYIQAIDYSREKVQTSPNGDGFVAVINRFEAIEREIVKEIHRFSELRKKIIQQIQQIDRPEYADILFRRYVEYRSFEEISSNIGYSYYRTCRMHGEALKEFEKIMAKDGK